ncbi:MAG: ATP cone domain-containing protein, partial [Planctomycetota bacterium]
MPDRKIAQVRKRDGRVVDYDEARIADAIYRAAFSTGQDNRYLADDLASVVTLYLEKYYESDLPSSDEIHQMVEKILFETGHAEIAKAFLLRREHKGRPSEPEPPPPAEDLFPQNRVLVNAFARGQVSAWGRDRITSALMKEAGLERASAEEVAAAVERRILSLGERRVSTAHIRDLVNHELLLRGYVSKVPRQIVVGLPKYDLGRLLDPGT